MNNIEYKNIHLMYLLQQETTLGDRRPKYLTGQISIPVPDELLSPKLVTFTETARKAPQKHYDHIIRTAHFSLARRDDQKFYIAQRKGFGQDDLLEHDGWKEALLAELGSVLDAISSVSQSSN